MRIWRGGLVLTLLFGCVLTGVAQELPMQNGATEITVWGGGGTGLGHSSPFQMANVGVRFGKVLTNSHGPGLLKGNFEYAADLVPLYLFFQNYPVLQSNGTTVTKRQTVYGGSISPVILKWNFTSGKKIVPFAAIEESAILTTKNVPAGDTAVVNFGSGIASGVQFLRDAHHSFSFSAHLMHISNASIGDHNPGINIGIQFRVGYQWWK